MSKLIHTNLRTINTRPVPVVIYYVRNGGNDLNPGTLALPFATFRHALNMVPSIIDDARYIIEVTGYQQLASGAFFCPPKVSSLPTDLQFVGLFPQDANLAPVTVVAVPSLFATLTVTGQVNDPTTTLVAIATSDNYALNQLRGKFVRGAVLGQWGVVASNTAGPNSTVYVSNVGPFTAPVQVLDTTCELALGDVANFYDRTSVCDMPCNVAFTGIKLSKANDSYGNTSLYARGFFHFQFCEIQGLYMEAGLSRVDTCYFNGGLLSANGHQLTIYESYLKNVNIQYHGDGAAGGQAYTRSVAEGCTPLGHHNNFQSPGGFDIDLCEIVSPKVDGVAAGAATMGVYYRGGNHGRVRSTKIGGATAAIYCEGPGYLLADNVQDGAIANTDVGCDLIEGGRAIRSGGTLVSGTNGQVRVGAAGIFAWAVPTTDPVQLCRLG